MSSIFGSVTSSMPTAAQRRVKQTLQLSRKLMEAQKSNQTLVKQLEEEKQKLAVVSEEVSAEGSKGIVNSKTLVMLGKFYASFSKLTSVDESEMLKL